MVSITHKYVSTNGDPPDSSLIGQTKWNDDHNVVGLTPGVDIQPYSPNLDSWSLVAPGSYLTVAAAAASYQPLATTLTSWASVTRASGFDAFVVTPSSANLRSLLTDETGTGAAVFANAPTLVSPVLGTPTSGNLANCTSYPLAQLSGAGTSVLTALSVNVGSAGAFVIFNGALGTPSSGTLTNCSGLPVSGIAASTSQPIGVGSIELGHASDTTLSRASAGRLAVEGVNVVTVSSTDTLTNKTLTDPIVGTQTALDNSTKAASTAYVDRTTREKLTANRTYYVRTDGSDANNGLSNASGGAFLTIQKAMDVVAALDISIYNVTIQCGDTGPFTGCLLKAPLGSGTVIINGDTANPSNYTFTKNGSSSYIFDGQSAVGKFQISGVHPHDATAAYHIISGVAGNIIVANNNDYGNCINYPLASKYGGMLQVTGANNKLSCSGTITAPFLCDTNSNLIAPSATTFTWLRNIAFGQFVLARWGGILNLANLTCTLGAFSATGSRYNADTNAVIITGGGGANFFPGSTAGSTSNGGLYT